MKIGIETTTKEENTPEKKMVALKQAASTMAWMSEHVIKTLIVELEFKSIADANFKTLMCSICGYAPSDLILTIGFQRKDEEHIVERAFVIRVDIPTHRAWLQIPKDPTPPTVAVWSDPMTPEQLCQYLLERIEEEATK